jgi:alpha-methylacyl-CoA racemase
LSPVGPIQDPSWTTRGDLASTGPLADLRVIDLSALLPGPFCAQMLADLGADVLKIEPPTGDNSRRMPSDIFATANRNKRGAILDLKRAEDRAVLLDLADDADVLIEGFRPGVVDRLGVGAEQVRARRPAIVYCSISGFGQQGPLRDRPGHDANYLAAGGALSYSGHWLGPPRRSGLPVADLAAAAYATIAILTALHDRDRTGVGAHIDVAMADAAMAFASARGGRRLDLPNADRSHLYPTNDLFEAADGEVLAVGAVEDGFWEALRSVLARDEPRLKDSRFDDEAGRRRHGDELSRLLDEVFARRPAREWLLLLGPHDVPVERVATLQQAATTGPAVARGIVRELDGERHVLFPALRDGQPMAQLRTLAPSLDPDPLVVGEARA